MSTLANLMQERLATGLRRRSVNLCSRWTEEYRLIGKPVPKNWTFKYHPWLRAMHDSEAVYNVGQKAAQMGYTETMLNIVFYRIDVRREDCLYVLPNKTPDASDFSSARFDAALDSSKHLRNLFSDTKNVGHKRAGFSNLYIRGSRGRSGLKSVPANVLIFDERDEMDQKQVTLGLERASGQFEKLIWQISTPTISKFGINGEFLVSTQEHFMFRCPHCSRITELRFPECIVVTADSITDPSMMDSHIVCLECKHKLSSVPEDKCAMLKDGYWEPTSTGVETRGFYINQLYSCTIQPWEIAKHMILAQYDQSYEQELHNSKMGLPHAVEGAQVTETEIIEAISDFRITDAHDTSVITTMGVDIGSWLHIVILQWELPKHLGIDLNTQAKPRVIYFGKRRDFNELDTLMRQYQINHAVVDMFPERRMAKQFADRFPQFVKLCYYSRGISGRSLIIPKDDDQVVIDWRINADRTSWLDQTLGRFHNGSIKLPADVDEEFKQNIQALVKKPGRDQNDNPTVSFIKPENTPDHYAHALNYAEIALPLAVSSASGQDIRSFL